MSSTQTAQALANKSLDAFYAKDMKGWSELCDPNVIVEFPFAPEGSVSKLEGRTSEADRAQVWQAIESVCREAGLAAYRADMASGSLPFMETIQSYIDKCWYCLFDLTAKRPNVYYKLGWADAHGHPAEATIRLARKGTVLHADLAHRQVRFYADIRALKKTLRAELKRMADEKV